MGNSGMVRAGAHMAQGVCENQGFAWACVMVIVRSWSAVTSHNSRAHTASTGSLVFPETSVYMAAWLSVVMFTSTLVMLEGTKVLKATTISRASSWEM